MTVRRGAEWGEPGALRGDAPAFESDREAAQFVRSQLRTDPDDSATPASPARPVEIGLLGGDLHMTLGSPPHSEADLRAGAGTRFPMDLAVVAGQGPGGANLQDCFLAHLVAMEGRRVGRLFSRRTVVVMNATHRDGDDLGPRAHPNDGRLDVTDGQLLPADRLRARRRMRSGTHLPHPMLGTSTAADVRLRFTRPAAVELDGTPVGSFTTLHVSCVADAVVVVA